jgi:hypothetical protein
MREEGGDIYRMDGVCVGKEGVVSKGGVCGWKERLEVL